MLKQFKEIKKAFRQTKYYFCRPIFASEFLH